MIVDALQIELDHERRISNSERLSVFRRNATTWELLMLLASEEDAGSAGLYKLAKRVHSDYLSDSALLKFMRERREDGLLLFETHAKRSQWSVRPDDAVLDELNALLSLRNHQLSRAGRARQQSDNTLSAQG
jgi:hypothetical protein